MSTTNHQWQPGNGSNYDITIGVDDDRVLLCWMKHGGSGGLCMWFQKGGYLDWTYMSEKMSTKNYADLAGILALVHELGLSEVGMPPGYGLDGLDDAHRKAKDLGPITDEEMQDAKAKSAAAWAKHAQGGALAGIEAIYPLPDDDEG
jgi:hypothetical protein